ncbi:hypothetical protein C3L33_10012, partial [Rhododendron williamsianum]
MSLFNYQSQKHHSSKHNKKRLTNDQVRLLEISFGSNKKLEPERKLQLARDLGIPPRQIAIWYQNKRARWKTQSLELDHSALQLRLEAASAEKKQLEKEVERLREELEKAHKLRGRYMQKHHVISNAFSHAFLYSTRIMDASRPVWAIARVDLAVVLSLPPVNVLSLVLKKSAPNLQLIRRKLKSVPKAAPMTVTSHSPNGSLLLMKSSEKLYYMYYMERQ